MNANMEEVLEKVKGVKKLGQKLPEVGEVKDFRSGHRQFQ